MTRNTEGKGQVYYSIFEVERQLLPKTLARKKAEDVEALGITLAKESLQKVKECLTKK
jgi:hypothetical protein